MPASVAVPYFGVGIGIQQKQPFQTGFRQYMGHPRQSVTMDGGEIFQLRMSFEPILEFLKFAGGSFDGNQMTVWIFRGILDRMPTHPAAHFKVEMPGECLGQRGPLAVRPGDFVVGKGSYFHH